MKLIRRLVDVGDGKRARRGTLQAGAGEVADDLGAAQERLVARAITLVNDEDVGGDGGAERDPSASHTVVEGARTGQEEAANVAVLRASAVRRLGVALETGEGLLRPAAARLEGASCGVEESREYGDLLRRLLGSVLDEEVDVGGFGILDVRDAAEIEGDVL